MVGSWPLCSGDAMSEQVLIEIVEEGGVHVVEIIHPGPPGPPGTGLPNGGNPGDILMKSDYANGDADWQPTLDGGTFF